MLWCAIHAKCHKLGRMSFVNVLIYMCYAYVFVFVLVLCMGRMSSGNVWKVCVHFGEVERK